jgi:hypothetical protein
LSAPTSPRRRRAGALLGGAIVAAVIYLSVSGGWLPGPVSLLLLVALLVAVPSAPELPRRLAVNGSVLIGWVPLAWWLQLPTSVNRSALLMALAWGVVVAIVWWAPERRGALARLRPELKPVDVVIPVGALLALAAMSRWAFAGTPRRALAVLLPGADNYGHFDMFAAIRTHGAMLSALGPSPDGSRWAYYNYPQGFHGLAATLSELLDPLLGTGPAMLPSYTRAVALVLCLGVAIVTAATISTAALRARPALVVPAVVVTWTGFLWEPGQKVITDGFANFWFCAAAAGTALLLGAAAPRFLSTPEVVALGGLLVACAYSWTPILVFAAPAVVALLVGVTAARPDAVDRRRVVWAGVVLVATTGAISAVVVILTHTVSASYVVRTATGGLHGTSPLPTFVLLIVGLYSCLSYPGWLSRSGRPGLPEPARVRALALAPALGFVVLSAFLVAQLQLVGTTEYYFLKYVIGFELVMAAFAPGMCALLVATRRSEVRTPRSLTLSVLGCVLASQFFGLFPHGTMPLFSTSGDGTAGLGGLSVTGVADGVLDAAEGTRAAETMRTEYFPLGKARALNPFYGDAWFHAVHHSLSEKVFERYGPWRRGCVGLNRAAALIAPVLQKEPGVRVVVNPRYVEPLRARMPSKDLARRLVGWDLRQGIR